MHFLSRVINLKWTLPFGAGTSSRTCSCPGAGTLPYSFRESQREEHPRTWRECLAPVVRIELDSGPSVCLTLRKIQANSWVFQTFPWALAVGGKAKGKVVPSLLLQERTCRATGGTSPRVKAALTQLQGGAAQLERSGQHWNSSWRAGAAQTPTQKSPLCWRQTTAVGTAREGREIIPKRAQLPPGSGPLTWHATQPGVWPSN